MNHQDRMTRAKFILEHFRTKSEKSSFRPGVHKFLKGRAYTKQREKQDNKCAHCGQAFTLENYRQIKQYFVNNRFVCLLCGPCFKLAEFNWMKMIPHKMVIK